MTVADSLELSETLTWLGPQRNSDLTYRFNSSMDLDLRSLGREWRWEDNSGDEEEAGKLLEAEELRLVSTISRLLRRRTMRC